MVRSWSCSDFIRLVMATLFDIIEVKDDVLYVKENTEIGYNYVFSGGVFDGSYPGSKTRRGRVLEHGKIVNTLTCNCGSQFYVFDVRETDNKTYNYRIRKLTERECFRLMGVDDKDIDTIQDAGISKTQQYKMAGNSIVVDVLYHIFRKLMVDTKAEYGTQLELF